LLLKSPVITLLERRNSVSSIKNFATSVEQSRHKIRHDIKELVRKMRRRENWSLQIMKGARPNTDATQEIGLVDRGIAAQTPTDIDTDFDSIMDAADTDSLNLNDEIGEDSRLTQQNSQHMKVSDVNNWLLRK